MILIVLSYRSKSLRWIYTHFYLVPLNVGVSLSMYDNVKTAKDKSKGHVFHFEKMVMLSLRVSYPKSAHYNIVVCDMKF